MVVTVPHASTGSVMRVLATAASWAAASLALASPTDNEFRTCHKLAAATLQHCLDEQPGADRPQCWSKSRAAAKRCDADIREEHRRMREPRRPPEGRLR